MPVEQIACVRFDDVMIRTHNTVFLIALFSGELELDAEAEADREVAMMFEADDVSETDDLPGEEPVAVAGVQDDAASAPGAGIAAPTPMPLEQLAPIPQQEDLFGELVGVYRLFISRVSSSNHGPPHCILTKISCFFQEISTN
jgi:hypothetical protein